MLNLRKILLPVDVPLASLNVIRQATVLARHFHSELVMLHVVTRHSHAAGVPEDSAGLARWDLRDEIMSEVRKQGDRSREHMFDGLAIHGHVVPGNTAA